MKKVAKWFALAASVAALVFSSCSNLVDDATISGDSIKPDGSRMLTAYASGSTDNIKFKNAGSSKMITPDALNGDDLVFFLWGEDQLSPSTALKGINDPRKIDFTAASGSNGTVGTVLLDLNISKYTLYLYACTSANAPTTFDLDGVHLSGATTGANQNAVTSKACLMATATVDMRYGQKVSFYLTPYTVPGTGSINIKLTSNWDHAIDSTYQTTGNTTVGLYSLVDDSAIVTPANVDYDSNQIKYTHAEASIPAGTYNYKVKFINGSMIYTWSDTIVILANQATVDEIDIPDIIGKAPVHPAGLTAKYRDPESSTPGYYDVEFLWKDASNNEEYFELQLLDLDTTTGQTLTTVTGLYTTSGVDATVDANWKTYTTDGAAGAATQKEYKYDVYSDGAVYVDGSLAANSQMLVLSLPLGSRYTARIRAVNAANVASVAPANEYVYVNLTLPDSKASGTAWTDFVAPVAYKKNGAAASATGVTAFPENALTISRFRVTYNLSDGIFTDATFTEKGSTSTYDLSAIGANNIKASRANIGKLTGTADAYVDYYTELYKDEASSGSKDGIYGNALLNPLYVANGGANSTTYPHLALAKDKNAWTSWRFTSPSGDTYWILDSGDTTHGATGKALRATSKNTTLAILGSETELAFCSTTSVGNYKGYDNLDLFAAYDAEAGVTIKSPALYKLADEDVLVLKEYATPDSAAAITSAVQIASITKGNEFKINNNTENANAAGGYNRVYLAVRDRQFDKQSNGTKTSLYSKITVTANSTSGGTKWTKTINVTGTTPVVYKQARYVLVSDADEPSNWTTGYANYYKKNGHAYTALAATEDYAKNKFYKLDADVDTTADPVVGCNYIPFEIPVSSLFGNGSYQITVKAYTEMNPDSPMTYVLVMNVQGGTTYSPTTFEPLDWATNKGNYVVWDSSNSEWKAATSTWTAGSGTNTGVWQKD